MFIDILVNPVPCIMKTGLALTSLMRTRRTGFQQFYPDRANALGGQQHHAFVAVETATGDPLSVPEAPFFHDVDLGKPAVACEVDDEILADQEEFIGPAGDDEPE
jgi:hypothetical protein